MIFIFLEGQHVEPTDFFSLIHAEDTNPYHWIEGGGTVEVGKDLASINLDSSLLFLNKEDTQAFQKKASGFSSDEDIGSIFPKNEKENWYVLFEYANDGYIKDDEKNSIDADAILKSYSDGTEKRNKDRKPEDQIHVIGWDVKPFYDESTHNLTWSLLAQDAQNEKIVNYNTRILTRQGYVSLILVSDPNNLEKDKQTLTKLVLPNFNIKSGQRYEDFNASKDKVSKYGLTGLILGGVGLAVAKKAGLIAVLLVFLKKGWILIAAAGLAIRKFFKGKFGRKKASPITQQSELQQPAPIDDNA